MLMVIFGAGASYDSDANRPANDASLRANPVDNTNRPPLANQLFDSRGNFATALSMFGECRPIVPVLRGCDDIEKRLERFQNEATEPPPYPERLRQLAAVRGYFQFLLSDIDDRWHKEAQGITNYVALIDEIRRWGNKRVLFVSFNYDRLIEFALTDASVLQFTKMDDYISGDLFTLVKVHGSVDWGRYVTLSHDVSGEGWDAVHTIIGVADRMKVLPEFVLKQSTRPIVRDGARPLVPAKAIPVQSKLDFECPNSHLQHMIERLPQVRRVLIVGWRAMDEHFVKLLREHLGDPLRVDIVCGNLGNAKPVKDALESAGINAEYNPLSITFTEYIKGRFGTDLLKAR